LNTLATLDATATCSTIERNQVLDDRWPPGGGARRFGRNIGARDPDDPDDAQHHNDR
jgi:hypothetical protein